MIERLLVLSIHNRALVVVLWAIFLLVGATAATRVPIDAVPDVTNTQVQVITAAPALGPIDVETYVTFPIERSMAGLTGLEEVRSISRAGISVVTMVFNDETELYFARSLVAQRLVDAKREIPAGYGDPQLGPVSSGLGEVYHFEVKGPQPLMARRTVLDWQVSPRLRLVPGVVEVNTFGGEARTMQITLDAGKLAAAKLGVREVRDAIERNHLAVGGAYVVEDRENVTVRGEGRVKTTEDLAQIVVAMRDDRTPLYLRDLGEVAYAPIVRYGAVTRDGRPDEAVVGVVMMLKGANSGKVVSEVKEALADIQKTLPEGMTIDAYYDRTDLVHRTIRTVGTSLVEASALVILVLLLTLYNLRAGIIVALSIPLALTGVFLGMWVGGVSGNLISLGAIDFGLVVDGAIIIVENALKRMARRREEIGRPLSDLERREVVLDAAREVRSATAFGEAIIALVYVPILALGSVEGRMFRPMALTVLFALASAFLLSLTLVPALASMILSRDATDKESFLLVAAHRIYRPLLARTMEWPKVIAAVTVMAFLGSLGLGAGMGREFLPKLDEGTMVLAMVRLPSVSLPQALDQARQVETTLRGFPEVTSVVCRTGRAEIAVDPMGINMTDVYVMLKPRGEWTTAKSREGMVEKFDAALKEAVPGAGFAFTQPIEMNTNDLLAGISSDLAIHVYGQDLATLKTLGDHTVRALRAVPGAKDVRAEQIAGMNVATVTVDRAALGRYGVDASTVLDAVAAVGGIQIGDVVDGAVRFPIQIRLDEEARRSPSLLAALPVRTRENVVVPLGQLATVELLPGPSQVSRERLSRRITVELNVRGRDIATFVEEAKPLLEKEVKLPAAYYTTWAGEYERLQSATKQLLLVVPIALVMIMVLLVATFGKLRPALLIFLNVPVGLTGGILALLARGLPLSISAGVGFIALFGVAVLNGLVLVSSIERLRERSRDVAACVIEGAEGRLRAVMTTAMVASLGFLPMAIATGAGAEVQRPLATVVIGGILSSTLLTMFVLPTVYAALARRDAPEPA